MSTKLNIQLFQLPEVPTTLKKFVSKEAISEVAILKLGSQAVFMWRHSVRLEIEGKEKYLRLTWYPSQGQQNTFFQAIIHFTIFNVIISVVKRLVGSHLDKISRTEWRHEIAAEYCSKWRQQCSNNVQILDFFGDEFHKEKLHLL